MASYWFRSLATGEKVIRDTVQEISRAAQREANRFGQSVQIHTGADGRKSHRKMSMARNPVMAGHDYSEEKWKVTGKNPRTGGFIHAYADGKAEAQNEARVLRGAGYVGVAAVKCLPRTRSGVGAKKGPVSKLAAMKSYKKNPIKGTKAMRDKMAALRAMRR